MFIKKLIRAFKPLAKKQLSDENLEKFFKLNQELMDAAELESENLKTVQDRFGHNDIQRVNADGVTVTVKEKVLWQEVYELGLDSDAGKVLEKKYPEVFKYAHDHAKKAEEFNLFAIKNFGLNPAQMTISALVNLILVATDYNIKKIIKENS